LSGATLVLKYMEAGLLEPLDRYLDEPIPDGEGKTWREDIHPSILKAVQWQRSTYSFPWYKEGFVILLNMDLFAEAGVDFPTDGQWTWDEFMESMKALTQDRDGDGRIDTYGLGFSTGKEKWEA